MAECQLNRVSENRVKVSREKILEKFSDSEQGFLLFYTLNEYKR